jgi:hypothetical protein
MVFVVLEKTSASVGIGRVGMKAFVDVWLNEPREGSGPESESMEIPSRISSERIDRYT